MLYVLGLSTLSTAANGGMRPMLLLLLIVAVILLLLGCSIALLTLRNQRKDYFAFITMEKSDSDREKY
jgi:ABC-type branched-subunit amino acid transport system permease subunit